MQKITVTVCETVFGTIVKEFTTMIDAMHFIQTCISNDCDFTVGIESIK